MTQADEWDKAQYAREEAALNAQGPVGECEMCHGSGAIKQSLMDGPEQTMRCHLCGGVGKRMLRQPNPAAPSAPAQEPKYCPACGGAGEYWDGPTEAPERRQCDACYGTGLMDAALGDK